MTHRSVSGSDIICNSSSSSLANIVRFGSLRIIVSLTILKRICFPYTYKEMFLFPSLIDIESHIKYQLKELKRYIKFKKVRDIKHGKHIDTNPIAEMVSCHLPCFTFLPSFLPSSFLPYLMKKG